MSEVRQAKYCPECGTMTHLDTPVCANCGHQFHTGVDVPPDAQPSSEDDEFNKTQMFTMSPLLMRRPDDPAPPVLAGEFTPLARLRRLSPARRVLLTIGILAVLAGLVWAGRSLLAPHPPHPTLAVGRWARMSPQGTVALMLAADGTGALFWNPSSGANSGAAGSVPLRWSQTPHGLLSVLPAGTTADAGAAGQSAALLASRPWPWRADTRTLTLGTITFARQKS